jgi:hypothetical protein
VIVSSPPLAPAPAARRPCRHPARAAGPVLAWLLFLLGILLPRTSFAQGHAPRLGTTVQPAEVEVGETFAVQLSAMSEGGSAIPASDPHLPRTPGLVLRSGPNITTQTQVRMSGGTVVQSMGIVATWHLEARRAGRFRVGPPSVQWGGRKLESNTVEITVLPRGSRPQRPRRTGPDPLDPFDIFGFPKMPPMPKLFDDDASPSSPAAEPPSDSSLAVNIAPDRSAFLRALTDKAQGVVGEQITLSIYQYTRTGAADLVEVHEPSAPDFFQRSLLSPGTEIETRLAYVGGSPWRVQLLRKIALFPLRAGQLEIGPMRATLVGFGIGGRGVRSEAVRESPPVVVLAAEPPAAGRPVGYRVGDVGSFALSATVEPRAIDQHGAVAVTVQLAGSGNLPASLVAPTRSGVEWLEPEVRERMDVQRDRVAGTRTFSYVVRLHEAGTTDLGEIALPFYDPDRRAYEVARAKLGRVSVARAAAPAPSASAGPDPFAAVAGPRDKLGAFEPAGAPVTDRVGFWVLLGACPLSVLALGAGAAASRRVGARIAALRASRHRAAFRSLAEARRARSRGDPAACAGAAERAIHHALEAAIGIKARGFLRAELGGELGRHGLDDRLAERVVSVLEACEGLRFDPDAAEQRLDDLIAAACEIVRDLGRRPKGAAA